MQSFLIALLVKVLESLLVKGTKEAISFGEFKKELIKAGKYKEVVDKPNNTREERRHAEDDMFS